MLSTGCWTTLAALSHQFLCQSKLEVQNLSDNIDWAYLRVVSIKDNISEQNIFKLYFKFQTARKNYRKIVIFHLINNTLQKKSTFENFAHQFLVSSAHGQGRGEIQQVSNSGLSPCHVSNETLEQKIIVEELGESQPMDVTVDPRFRSTFLF